jgi:branched-chain amino acid transport system ATP-binding protein
VEENIRLAASCGGGSPQATTIESVFNSLPQIAAIRAQYVGKLSGGERTLVAFARAIALRPNLRLLLLDELSSSLSLTNARVVASLLANLRQEGTAILLAEQNIAFAQSLGIRLLKPNWQFGRG